MIPEKPPTLEEFFQEWKERVLEQNPNMTDFEKKVLDLYFDIWEHHTKNPKYFEDLKKFLDEMKAKYPEAFKK